MRRLEEALPRKKECDVESAKNIQGKDRSGIVTASTRKFPWNGQKKQEQKSWSSRGVAGWQMAATSLYDDVFLDTEECYK